MFRMQYIQVSLEAACFSEHFDTAFKKKSVIKRCGAGRKTSGWGLKGGHKKKDFPQIVISSKPFKTSFFVLGYRSWVSEFIPTIEITIRIFLNDLIARLFYRWLHNPTLGQNPNFNKNKNKTKQKQTQKQNKKTKQNKTNKQTKKKRKRKTLFWKFEDYCTCNIFSFSITCLL